jgi:nucleoside-diphosphate-sugar epimerase
VAQAFLFGIDQYDSMKGEPYNGRLSFANLTKRQLCGKIKEHIYNFYIHSTSIGEDPDKQAYLVSNDKNEYLGCRPHYTLDDGIKELIKGFQMLQLNMYANV